jgi:hypothetical protein
MPTDPLALPATPRRVREIARVVPLAPHVRSRALTLVDATPDSLAWHRFLSRVLLLVGAWLVLSGVVCFVAFNWNRVATNIAHSCAERRLDNHISWKRANLSPGRAPVVASGAEPRYWIV